MFVSEVALLIGLAAYPLARRKAAAVP